MKKAIFLIIFAAIILTGCSTNVPLLIGDGTVGPRTGQATGKTIFGIGNVDAGMITAARNAGITKIGAVDYQVKRSVFGIITTYTTTVTGQ